MSSTSLAIAPSELILHSMTDSASTSALPINQKRVTRQSSNLALSPVNFKRNSPLPQVMQMDGASPMSFGMAGMSFTGGNMMKSWKQSFSMNGNGAFAGFSGHGANSFGASNGGISMYPMDAADPFLYSANDPSLSFSFTGMNGSYRSPSGLRMSMNLSSSQLGRSFVGPQGASYTKTGGNWRQKEAEFCKDFTCCGKDLGNLHDLLDHYEEAHVVVISSPGGINMELTAELDTRAKYDDDDSDIDMDSLDEEEPSSSGSSATSSPQPSPTPTHALPGLLPTSSTGTVMTSAMKQLALDDLLKPNATTGSDEAPSAFDSFVVSSPPKGDSSLSSSFSSDQTTLLLSRKPFIGTVHERRRERSAEAIKSAFGTAVRKASPDAPSTSPINAVAPSNLFSSGASTVHESPVLENAEASSSTAQNETNEKTSDGEPKPSLFATHRPFRCPQPGCQKAYKQSNGLKYHIMRGQCNFEVRDAVEWGGLTQEEAEERARPFVCAAGEGCTKRYRQMNGLKYHYMNSGLHGEIGLILLAQGQHPLPATTPASTVKKPVNPPPRLPNLNAKPVGWVKNAVKLAGKDMGLPLNGVELHGDRKGEEAVLFTTHEKFEL